MELIEESEQMELNRHKKDFECKRNAELMVTQRLEGAHKRRNDEKVWNNLVFVLCFFFFFTFKGKKEFVTHIV